MSHPFTPEIVTAVLRHMNEDHAADSLLIVRTLGGRPDALDTELTGIDPEGAVFEVVLPDGRTTVRLPWSEQVTERPQFRQEFARMYHEAVDLSGV